MSTIRGWLNDAGFDWSAGTVIYHHTTGTGPGRCRAESAEIVDSDSWVLDWDFSPSYGNPECPRFVAFDGRAIYFPWQYDGSTGLQVVVKDPGFYLDPQNETPYPGG